MSHLDFDRVFQQEDARLRKLHPTFDDLPGCISAFDDYIGCGVIRNQMKSLYRFGGRVHCDQKFQELKFCMSQKVKHPEEQYETWIRRRAEWWTHRRLAKSSEDVWDIREEPLKNYPKPITEELMLQKELS